MADASELRADEPEKMRRRTDEEEEDDHNHNHNHNQGKRPDKTQEGEDDDEDYEGGGEGQAHHWQNAEKKTKKKEKEKGHNKKKHHKGHHEASPEHGEENGNAEKKTKKTKKEKEKGHNKPKKKHHQQKREEDEEEHHAEEEDTTEDRSARGSLSGAGTPTVHTDDDNDFEEDPFLLPRRSISADGEEIFTDEDIQGYPFSEPDSDANILFTGETAKTARPVVRAGTLEKLIQRLTWEAYPDPVYMNAFLLTYRSFTTPVELLHLLKVRYNVPLPTRATASELEQFVKTHQNPIRLRVFNVAKRWLSDHFYDFAEDRSLIEILNNSIIRAMITSPDVSMQKAGEQLATLLKQKIEGIKKEMRIQFNKPPPPPILPPGFNGNGKASTVKFMEIDPVEMARQLTLIEYSLYRAIKPQECLGQAWNKKTTRDDKAKNIMMMIQHFNQISRWATSEIVKVANIRDRAAVLARFIDIAHACMQLNNYNAAMEILSGLQSSAIFRLKHTWAMLKKDHKKKWQEVTELLSREKSFQKFREHLHNVDPPCIPYLGLYLTDLTFIEDGNKDFINDSLINFDKRRKISQVIMEIQQYQATPYCLEEIPALRDYLQNLETMDENEAYSHSLQVEPKNMPPPESHTGLKAMGASWTSGLKATLNKKKEKKQTKEEAGAKDSGDKPVVVEEEEEDWGELESLEDDPFSVPDSKDNIILDVDVSAMIEGTVPTIKAATLAKLIEKLTNERYCDPSLVDSFLLTHAMFSTPAEVMALLKKRFSVPLPRDTANKELQDRYHQAKVLPVRLRVFNMAKHWLDRYSQRCIDDEGFNKELDDLVQKMLDSGMEKVAAALRHSLQRQKEGGYNYEAARRGTLQNEETQAAPVGEGNVAFADVDPEELARHLTLTQQALFFAIKPWELLAQSCVKKTDPAPTKETTPKYHALLEHNERLVSMIVATIISSDSTETASGVVTKWVRVADKCLSFNNYNAIVQIITALQIPDIQKVIWTGLPFTTKTKINKMRDLVDADNRYAKLQDKLRRVQPPCVPYIGAFVELIREHFDKLPDHVQGLINFEKYSLISAEISEFQQYQPIPYNFPPSASAQRWWTTQTVYSPDETTILTAKLSTKRGASKTVILSKIEQRRSQHTLAASGEVSLESSSSSVPTTTEESTEENGLGSSPSMTKKLKKAFKPSTISRSSSTRSSRSVATSPSPSAFPSSPLSARASVRSTSHSNLALQLGSAVNAAHEPQPASPTPAGLTKDELLRLLRHDAEFRASVMAEVVQSPEIQDLLRKEREAVEARFQEEFKELKQTMMSELITSFSSLLPSAATTDSHEVLVQEAQRVASPSDQLESEAEVKPSDEPADVAKESPSVSRVIQESSKPLSESGEIKTKLNLPDFG